MACQRLGSLGLGDGIIYLVGPALLHGLINCSQLIALTETAGKPGKGVAGPQRAETAMPEALHGFLSTGETAGDKTNSLLMITTGGRGSHKSQKTQLNSQ